MRRKGSIKAPKMRRQEGDSAGAGAMPEIGRKNRRLPIAVPELDLRRRSSRNRRKNPPPLPCRLLHRRLQPRLLLIRHRWWRRLSRRRKFPPLPCRLLHKRLPNRLLLIRHRWWRRLSRRRKFPPLPCRLLHKRLPKPPFADTPPPLTTMQMVESSAESNLPQEEYKEIMLDGTSSVVAKPYHAAANTPAMQQVETAGKRDGA